MSVRYKDGLQVATDTYEKDGRTVTLIGVSHVADERFWVDTQELISAKESNGAAIHYEQVENDMPGPQPRAINLKALAPELDMQHQFDGIDYRATWLRTDILWSEFMAHARRKDPKQPTAEQLDAMMQMMTGSPKKRRVTRWFISRLLPVTARLPLAGPRGVPRSIIIDKRNEIAATAALKETGDVVAIWGAAHLPGIGRLLRGQGFIRTARAWNTAITTAGDD